MERGNDQYVTLQLYLQPLLKVKGSFDHLLPLIFFCASQMAQRVEESTCHCRRCKFNPWVRKIPWRRKWQPTPEFLPGKSHGQRNLAGYSPWGHKELDMTEQKDRERFSSVYLFPSLLPPDVNPARECILFAAEMHDQQKEVHKVKRGFPGGSDGKEPTFNAKDRDSICKLGRHLGEGDGYPLQYSCLENSMDTGTC